MSLINDGYIKPKITISDSLSKDDIQQKLLDYEKIDISKVGNIEKGTHIRYFKIIDGEYKYCPGGILIINKSPEYIVLGNGNKKWSVQLNSSIIFQQLTIKRIKEEYEEIIKDKEAMINHYRLLVTKQNKELDNYRDILKNINKNVE